MITVDIDTTISDLETVASAIVANIKLNPKWYGGDYRVFLKDACPGFKLQLAVYYNHADNGACSQRLRCGRVFASCVCSLLARCIRVGGRFPRAGASAVYLVKVSTTSPCSVQMALCCMVSHVVSYAKLPNHRLFRARLVDHGARKDQHACICVPWP
jgi:hypothetical protein